MSDFESAIQTAVDTKDIPGCVLGAKNRDGTFNYSKSFGSSSMDPERAKPLSPDTVMWVASCTKLMTSIAAMQLVERGLVSLDEPVYKHIPELESFNVLKGFEEDGKPIEEKHTKPITLKLLLTHSSGLSYDFVNPKLAAWAAYKKVRLPVASKKLLERFSLPLVFEPGEGWMYGPSIDYAGLLVERITGKSLEEYLRENLWEPLGVKDVTFRLGTRPDMKARMADMSERDESGKVTFSKAPLMYFDDERVEDSDCLGGQGSLTTAGEYLKILDALLNAETDERILKKESVETFFSPHLGDKSSAMLNAMLQDDMTSNAMGGIDKSVTKDWGLGGILLMGDSPDGKKAGTMVWGGYPNLIWWVDRKTGVTGLYAGQVIPPGDAKCAALNRKFEAGIYEKYSQNQRVSTLRL